ncbi:hypothetical protein ACJMK2_018271 [Sinanodonta woodiana]|uniref:Uncharacterized protein n=1 Tax=Sinanodonta woodiana TaxID=1069815 RepID=A0ABD3UCZ8_SINWO
MSHEKKRKDRESIYRDQNGSFTSSMPRWADMLNKNDGYGGYEYMDPWRKMGLKYAPKYYHNEPGSRHADPSKNSSSSGDTDSHVQNEKPVRKRLEGRKLALIVIVVGLIAIAAAITVILVLSLKPAESQPNKFRVVTMSLAVDETFKPEYKNQSSAEYKLFAGNFTSAMDEIFQANNTKGYKGTQIVELKNGSVIVIFTGVIEFKLSDGPPGEEVLKTVITGQKIYENDNNIVVVKNFKILKASISIVKTEEFAFNPISTTVEPKTISTITEPRTLSTTAEIRTTSTTATKATTTTSMTSPPSQGQNNFSVATVNLAVNDTFKPEYNNASSVEYQTFSADFTNAMDKIFNNTEGYKGIKIQELKSGSVIVIFIIVIEVKSNVTPPGQEELKAVITGQKRDANDNVTVVIEKFRILTTSVSIVAIDKVKTNPIFPTDDSTTTQSSTPATTLSPSTSTTVKANVTASTSASNVQLNSTTTPSTLTVSTPPTQTSSTLQPSTTTSTSTITTTATTTITSQNTTSQKAISSTILTSSTTPIVTSTIATTQTSMGPGTISTSNPSSASTLTSTTTNTTSPTLSIPSTISTTLSNSPTANMATTTASTSTTATNVPTTSLSTTKLSEPNPASTSTSISTTSLISSTTSTTTPKYIETMSNTVTTSTSTTKSSIITYNTTSTKPDEANMTSTTTSTTTISLTPGTNSTTLSKNPTSVMPATTSSTLTTAANITTPNISSTNLPLPNTTSATTRTSATSSTMASTTPTPTASLKSTITSTISTKSPEQATSTATTSESIATSIKTTLSTTKEPNATTTTSTSTTTTRPTTNTTSSKLPDLSTTSFINSTNSTATPKYSETMSSTATTSTSTTKSSIITYNTTTPKPDEANMTSTTTSTTTISLKPVLTSTTLSNNPTSVMSASTSSTLTTAGNVTTPNISSTKPPEPNTTSAATRTSATSSTITSTTPTPTSSLKSTITSTMSTKSPEPTTSTATTSESIATSIKTTLSTTKEPNVTTTTSTSTTTTRPTTNTTSSKLPDLSTTSFINSTNSTATPKYSETNTTTAITATSSSKSSIIIYNTTSPKPDEANMTSTTTSTTTISLKPGLNSTTLSNNPTSVMPATTSSTLTTAANVTTPNISSTKPPEPNTTSAATRTSATSSTITSTTQTPTASLKSTITSTMSTKSPEPTTSTATTSESIASTIKTTLSTTSPKPTETNLTSTTTSTSTTNLTSIITSTVVPITTVLNTTITSTSTSTTTLMPNTTSTFIQSTSEPNATNATAWTTSYTTKPSSTAPSTMATTNSSTVSTVSTNSTTGPSSTSYKTIETTSTTPKGVAFNTKYYTAVVGVSLQLVCTITGWNGNLSISRVSRTKQQEIMVVVNNTTGTILNGFAVNITFTGYTVDVSILILNASCEDEGTYYCTTGAVSDNATVKREREKPILQLPDIMVRDNYHDVKYPFVCETDIANSGEILIAEVNKNGTFYLYEGYAENRVNITTDCGNKQRFTFFINGIFTSVWDNAKIRCVLINNSTNGDTRFRLVSEESTIKLVPADICLSVTDGSNISHPQSNCELFLTCLNGVPVPGKCKQGQCFYDNIGMCRAPICPFVYCNDADANIGEPTSLTCSLLYCNDSFLLTIKHLGETLFSSNNITGNISQRSEDRNIQVWLTNGKAELTVAFLKTNCNDSGEYIIILGKENVIDRGYLTFKVPPKKPTLQLPQSIVAYTQANITCYGEQGIPRQNMYIEVMFNGSNYTKYDNTILTTDDKNCSSMGILVMNFLAVEKWQHARVRCVIGDNSSSRLESDVYEINTTNSGVSISPSEITGFINDTVQINCTVTGIMSNDSVIVSRLIPTFQGEEILSILTNGNSTKNNLTWIRFSTTVVSANSMIIHITINFLQCRDGGTYRCKTGNRTAIASLAIWSKPDKPSLMLPVEVVSDGFNQAGDPFVCKGNVGYPGGNLLALIKSNGTFKEVQPYKVNVTKGTISNCQKVDIFEFYLGKFTMDLHNSTLRCVAANNETIASGESDPYDEKVLLLVPGTTCSGMDGLTLPYPFDDCKKYVLCVGNRTFVRNGGCKDGDCYYTDTKRCEQQRTTTTIARNCQCSLPALGMVNLCAITDDND